MQKYGVIIPIYSYKLSFILKKPFATESTLSIIYLICTVLMFFLTMKVAYDN